LHGLVEHLRVFDVEEYVFQVLFVLGDGLGGRFDHLDLTLVDFGRATVEFVAVAVAVDRSGRAEFLNTLLILTISAKIEIENNFEIF